MSFNLEDSRRVTAGGKYLPLLVVVMAIVYVGFSLIGWMGSAKSAPAPSLFPVGNLYLPKIAAEFAGVSKDKLSLFDEVYGATSESTLTLMTSAGSPFRKSSKQAFIDGLSESTLPVLVKMLGAADWSVILGWVDHEASVAILLNDGVVKWFPWNEVYPKFEEEFLVAEKRALNVTDGSQLWVPGGRLVLDALSNQKVHRQTVTLFNIGSRMLKIQSVSFSCGCTKGKLESVMIPPSGHSKLQLEIDVSGLKAANFTVSLMVSVDGQDTQMIPIVGEIERPARFSPDYFALGVVTPDSSTKELDTKLIIPTSYIGKVHIEPIHLDPGMRVLDIKMESASPEVKMSVNGCEAKRDSGGFFRSEATFAINGIGERKLITIGAVGRLAPAITVQPSIISIGAVAPGQEVVKSVRFKSVVKGKTNVSCVHPEYCKVRVNEDQLEIRFTAPPAPNVFRTGLLLRVGTESVTVPIVGTLRETVSQ